MKIFGFHPAGPALGILRHLVDMMLLILMDQQHTKDPTLRHNQTQHTLFNLEAFNQSLLHQQSSSLRTLQEPPSDPYAKGIHPYYSTLSYGIYSYSLREECDSSTLQQELSRAPHPQRGANTIVQNTNAVMLYSNAY